MSNSLSPIGIPTAYGMVWRMSSQWNEVQEPGPQFTLSFNLQGSIALVYHPIFIRLRPSHPTVIHMPFELSHESLEYRRAFPWVHPSVRPSVHNARVNKAKNADSRPYPPSPHPWRYILPCGPRYTVVFVRWVLSSTAQARAGADRGILGPYTNQKSGPSTPLPLFVATNSANNSIFSFCILFFYCFYIQSEKENPYRNQIKLWNYKCSRNNLMKCPGPFFSFP